MVSGYAPEPATREPARGLKSRFWGSRSPLHNTPAVFPLAPLKPGPPKPGSASGVKPLNTSSAFRDMMLCRPSNVLSMPGTQQVSDMATQYVSPHVHVPSDASSHIVMSNNALPSSSTPELDDPLPVCITVFRTTV